MLKKQEKKEEEKVKIKKRKIPSFFRMPRCSICGQWYLLKDSLRRCNKKGSYDFLERGYLAISRDNETAQYFAILSLNGIQKETHINMYDAIYTSVNIKTKKISEGPIEAIVLVDRQKSPEIYKRTENKDKKSLISKLREFSKSKEYLGNSLYKELLGYLGNS